MEGMVEGMDRSTMRPLQKESYLCMAKCCDRCAGAGAGNVVRMCLTAATAQPRSRWLARIAHCRFEG